MTFEPNHLLPYNRPTPEVLASLGVLDMAAATMASINGCHRYDHVKLMNQGIIRALMGSHSSFSSSSSILSSNKFHKQLGRRQDQFGFPPTNRLLRLRVQVQYTQSTDKISSSSSSTMKGEDKKKAYGSDQKVTVYGGKTKAMMIRVPSKVEVRESVEDELKVMAGDEGGFMSSWGGIDGNNIDFWRRSMVVWSFVVSLSARVVLNEYKWAYFGGFTQDKQKSRRRRSAEWLREQILKLGPTFIKTGQLCSTRSDLFPQEFVHELSKLQDRVPAFSAKKARDIIERELGAPIHELFYKFDHHPIAAASLGQVHRAILHNGEKVAVKVQRAGLKKLFDMDLRNLKLIAEYFQRSETFGGPTRDWISIYEECAMILYQEIDYMNEGKNADRFRRDFRHVKWVRVPLVFWDYTAREVLTMEYTPGIKINKLDTIVTQGHDRSQISSRAIESYLIQILKTGFFHADPHPGNLAIDVDGALIYYDFGMMGEIKSSTRERLLDLFCAVYERDDKKVIQILKDLEVLGSNGDMSSVRRSVKFLLDNLLNQIDQQKTLATIGEDLFATAPDVLCLPSSLTFVMKAFSTLEGIGYMLDPNFSFAKIAAPFAEELFASKQKQHNGKQLVEEIRRQANEARTYAISMPYRIQRIEEFTEQLESGDLRLRVRVLESERAAQKAAILQKATIYTVLGGVLMNMGITFGGQSDQVIANGSFIGASVFFVLFIRSMQKAKKPDKFEKMF